MARKFNFDIYHLRIFFETCNEKSFTKAANVLYISQSAVSIQIKKLETLIGEALIERNSKTFKLTHLGKELYNHCEKIFSKIDRMEYELSKMLDHNNLKLVIGATHNIGEPILPSIVTNYSQVNPNISFDLYVKNSDSLIKALYDGLIDVALIEVEPVNKKEFVIINADTYPYVAIAPPHITNIEDVKNMTLLLKESQIVLNKVEKLEGLIKHHFDKVSIVNGSNETIKNLIMNGFGISILPYFCVFKEIQDKKINLIYEFEQNEENFQMIYLKENKNKKLLIDFVEFFKNYNIKFEFESIVKKQRQKVKISK